MRLTLDSYQQQRDSATDEETLHYLRPAGSGHERGPLTCPSCLSPLHPTVPGCLYCGEGRHN